MQWLPAQQARRYSEPLVLLHGWGCDSRSWQPLLSPLNQNLDVVLVELPGFGEVGAEASSCNAQPHTLDNFFTRLLAALPPRFLLLGWSLGGMLATQLAAQYPKRVAALMTLATNVHFVADECWPTAMPATDFDSFVGGFQQAPELTLKRFAGLMAKGDADERSLLKSLRQHAQQALDLSSAEQWLPALQWLAHLDNRSHFAALKQPGLHLLADGDALVPVALQQPLQALNRQQRVEVIASTAHALHWSATDTVANSLLAFVDTVYHGVDKRKVAESFGRAAQKYDSVATVQRQIGHELLTSVGADNRGTWLDLGCGTGYFTPHLVDRCESVLGLDLAQGMVNFARQRLQAERPQRSVQWLGGDAEALPLADACLAGVFSSLAIQWCANVSQLFSELHRVLQPGGRVLLATLGPRTLHELRQAWSAVDHYTHVNRFAPEEELRQAIAVSGLTLERWRSEEIVLRYPQVRELTYALKTLGAHNMNPGQSSGLTGRQRLRQFKQAYEQFRRSDSVEGATDLSATYLPATYEVFYLELTR